jgi:L-malate glycosyltransferase
MKICFLAPANSIHSLKWIKYFSEKGHEVYWLSLHENKFGNHPEIKFYNLRLTRNIFLNVLVGFFYLNYLMLKIKPDILHVHCLGINSVACILSFFHPLAVTPWGSDILVSKRTKWFAMRLLKKADIVTCDALHMKKIMEAQGVNSNKIKLINFGVDINKFEHRQLKPSGEKFVIISLRSLEDVYRVDTLIRAIPFIIRKLPAARFLIVGSGEKEKELKQIAANFNVLKNIEFLGYVQNDKLCDYLNSADVYISTSASDAGLASSTAEAMACGLPVLVSDFGDNGLWVGKDYVFPIGSYEALAEKIIFLLENRLIREEAGIKNRKIIEEKNNYQVEMKKMEDIYLCLK